MWTAPELLREDVDQRVRGSQRGDIYSFGILMYEILCRNGPYGDCHLSPQGRQLRPNNIKKRQNVINAGAQAKGRVVKNKKDGSRNINMHTYHRHE